MATQRRPRGGPGRPSKGDRHAFLTRVNRPPAERAMAEATARGLSYSEYLAIVIARAHGFDEPMPEPMHEIAEQEALSISA